MLHIKRRRLIPDDYPPLWGDITITARLTVDAEGPEQPCRFTEAVIERD